MTIYIIIPFLFFLITSLVQGQNQNDSTLTILEAPVNWRSEFLTFPLSFAPSIEYTGVEDIRFSEGWADKNSQEFWSYVFVWYLENDPQLTEIKLQNDMDAYFDGLMESIAKSKELSQEEISKTSALFRKNSDLNDDSGFIGKINIYDAFFLQAKIELNVTVKINYYPKTDKYSVLFNISPKEFENEIWIKLKEIKINLIY